jgi:phosphate transport system substrate-binding protein
MTTEHVSDVVTMTMNKNERFRSNRWRWQRDRPATVLMIWLEIVVLMAWLVAACSSTPTPTLEPVLLTLSGSTEMAPLLTQLSDPFRETRPHVAVTVRAVNSAFGVEQAKNKEGTLGAVAVDPPEKMWAAPIAVDGIALVVHPDNPLQNLTLVQARDIFSGRLWHWRDLGVRTTEEEITVISREEGSGTRKVFETSVMEGDPVTPTAVVMPGGTAVIAFVAKHPGAIGYVSQGLVSPKVRAVPIEGLAPVPELIADRSYPLVRPLYLVAPQEPTGVARQFVDFCLSAEGQAIVAQRYAPVRAAEP